MPEARHKPLADVFRIVNEQTHETVENPIDKVRRLNGVVGLANHTILISKNGQEFAIDDSASPIRDAAGGMTGIALVFRDVTQQRNLEAALWSNERLAVAGRLSASIAHEIHDPLDTACTLNSLVLLGGVPAVALLEQRLRTAANTSTLVSHDEHDLRRLAPRDYGQNQERPGIDSDRGGSCQASGPRTIVFHYRHHPPTARVVDETGSIGTEKPSARGRATVR